MVPEHLPVSHVLSSFVAMSRSSAMIALRSRPSDGMPRSTGKRSAYGYALILCPLAPAERAGQPRNAAGAADGRMWVTLRSWSCTSRMQGGRNRPEGFERGDELRLQQFVGGAVLGAGLDDADGVDHAGEVGVGQHPTAIQRVERGGAGDGLVRIAQRRDRSVEDVGEGLHPLVRTRRAAAEDDLVAPVAGESLDHGEEPSEVEAH